MGCIRDDEIIFVERLHTDTKKSELEYAISIKTVLEIYGIDRRELDGGILSSAVPPLTSVMRRAAAKVTGREPLVVGPGVKTGLDIRIDNPAQLGSDLVVGAVAAIEEYPCPQMCIRDRGQTGRRFRFLWKSSRPGAIRWMGSSVECRKRAMWSQTR